MEDNRPTLQQLMKDTRRQLAAKYGEREASAMVDEMLFRIKGWDRTATIIHGSETVTVYLERHVYDATEQLLDGKPIQYIFGKANFYGMDFGVTSATLIPRPETAQLVDIIVDDYGHRTDLNVLDLGTGSGCIAIALARTLPFPFDVTAVDISSDALAVARDNALNLKVKVNFMLADMLDVKTLSGRLSNKYNIIVSNPPYIAEHEKSSMDSNVLDYEPASALFVPDNDPLRFYRAIAAVALKALADDGTLYLEINPLYATELTEMLRAAGFSDITVEKDMQKADRFVIAKR
ncbi:MAG: peptide chain release factor N(5)-glutamine methyltransferase [Barnesiella sp.]|nr:peptide chain release factor N(5)-glutamine methyltransferase [Bacteroidales bacterium]MBD5248256.1 peptide chain release factor N(5)-glutamine methyltransferase [Barnesiella sp.]